MARDVLNLRGSDPLPDPFEAFVVGAEALLEERGESSRALAVRRLPFRRWVERVPEVRGPLDFARFAFQVEMYDERSAHDPELVVMKSTQVGVSTLMVRWVLFHADVHGRNALYTFPTDRELSDFSRQRIRPVIRASEHLMSRIPSDGVDNVGQKQVGQGWVYFRGTQQRPVDSIDADVIVFDEYDTSNQAHLEGTERRISSPLSAGLLRRVGVPTIPGFGIAKAYDESDQRVWTVKCAACSVWNPMRGAEAFASNVDQEAMAVVCRKCRRRLDLRLGEWVAAFPDRDVRGYHVPKLVMPGAKLRTIVADSRKTRPDQRQAFFNRDLGEAYAPAEGRLSLEQVRGCVNDHLKPLTSLRSDRFVTMGIDVASVRALNVVIEEALDERRGRRVFVGEIEDDPARGTAFEQLCQLMNDFGVTMACIDHAPEGRFAEAFAGQFPGRVYRAGYFNPQPGQRTPELWHVDDVARYVGLWRTRAVDATLERFRLQHVALPPLGLLPADYPAHLGALVRRTEEQPNGNLRTDYVKTGADDYAHAEVYNLAAIELVWRRAGIELATRPVELTAGRPVDEVSGMAVVYRPGFEE